MGRDSATEAEWKLLRFVAYEFIADGMSFQTKEEANGLYNPLTQHTQTT